MSFNKMFEKHVTSNDIKSDQKPKPLLSLQSVCFFIYIFRVKVWIFLKEASTLDFAELVISYSI